MLEQGAATRVGTLLSLNARSVAGNDAFVPPSSVSGSKLCVNLEVFNASDSEVSFLQIRSLAVKGREEALAADVISWAHAAGFGRVVVVGGADATMRTDTQLAPG